MSYTDLTKLEDELESPSPKKKSLNVEGIVNELKGESAFFKTSPSSNDSYKELKKLKKNEKGARGKTKQKPDKMFKRTSVQVNKRSSERMNKRTDERMNESSTIRSSYDLTFEQKMNIANLALKRQQQGKRAVTKSEILREIIDKHFE